MQAMASSQSPVYADVFTRARETGLDVVSVSDHATGGITLGYQLETDPGCYPPYTWGVDVLLQQRRSFEAMAASACTSRDLAKEVDTWWGIPCMCVLGGVC